MKIAYVYDAIYPYSKGGAEKRIWELSRRLSNRGHEVHILGMKYWSGPNTIIHDGVFLHGVCKARSLYNNGIRSVSQALLYSFMVIKPLLINEFDIIDCQAAPYFSSFSSKLASIIRNTKLIITWHEVWEEYWYQYLGKKGLAGKLIEKITAHLTPNNIAVSQRTKNGLVSISGRRDIKIIPNGIDVTHIFGIRKAHLESDIIFVGRLSRNKNVDVLIDAIRIIKNTVGSVTCLIIGEGPEKQNLMRRAHFLNLSENVLFIDFLNDYEEMIAYVKASKIFVLPSTREGFGIVVLEANACGLPVITVSHPMNAASDLIENNNGFVCQLSAQELSKNILLALKEREHMTNNCIASAKKYDWDNIVKTIELSYQEIVKKSTLQLNNN